MPAAIPASTQWAPVRAALTSGVTNPATIANGSVLDGVTLVTGDRFVCVGARTDAGVYVVGAGSSSRATDADEASEFFVGRTVQVTEGSDYNVGTWVLLTAGAITLGVTTLTLSYLLAEDIEIPGSSFDNSPAIPISTASSTTIYYGISAQATLTAGQAQSDLLSIVQPAVGGTYVCAEGGYKYLLVPASMTAPTAIRDLSSGLAVMLAGPADGYGNTTSNLTHASVAIDGVTYRVYRSSNQLAGALSLQVS